MAIDRHINFFELQKACAGPGCPLCRIIADRAERYIDNMLFEHISDRGFRAAYRAAGGFCGFHARNLESFRDGLAVAILGRDILEDRLRFFRARKVRKPKGRCPVCEEQDRIEEEYLSFLAGADEGKKDDDGHVRELRQVFTGSEGLCVPHYGRLLVTPAGRSRPVPRWLREFHENRFEELLRLTGQFIELSAYGRQEEFAGLPEDEKRIWKRLAVSLRGGM
ncbi:MAG: hypothetical protein LBD78_09590 [Spirochaetaceae bacterium]|jgi:hypothetical protein|nr:hypothetical protein [Spirochaetaceae bacterium]